MVCLELGLLGLTVGVIAFVLYPDQPPLHGVYAQKGKWYHLKKFVFLILLKLRKRQSAKSKKDGKREKEGAGYGMRSRDTKDEMELAQPLSDHPWAIDSVYFNGVNAEGAYFVMRIARRHNRICEIWFSILHPRHGFFQSPAHPDGQVYNTDGQTYSADGLQFQCLEPHRRWRLTFNGFMRKGMCNDWKNRPNNFAHIKFSFIWEAFTDIFDFDTDIHPSRIADAVAREKWSKEYFQNLKDTHQTHYEQWGELQGTFQVENGDLEKMSLRGFRDHSFGVRDWKSFYRYVVIFGYFEDGSVVHLSAICLPITLSNLKTGYIFLPCGIMHPVTWTDMDLASLGQHGEPDKEFKCSFTAGGKTYKVGVKNQLVPKYFMQDDWCTVINECMCEMEMNGVKGSGIVEWIYRNDGGSPVPPNEPVPGLFEADLSSLQTKDKETYILPFASKAATCSGLVGGKGCQLALLTRYDSKEFNVPPGFCVTLAAFQKQLKDHQNLQERAKELDAVSCKRRTGDLQEICKETVKLIKETEMASDVQEAIKAEIEKVFSKSISDKLFAVRSSAAGEDSDEMSAAGQMDTYLGVKGTDQILDAVKKCWASYFAFPAVEYRRQHGQPIVSGMGVVVQEMVKSETAGVLFTRDPLNGNPAVMSINANYGLGESVVSGSAEPDTITLSRSWDGEVKVKHIEVGGKKTQITARGDGETEETAVGSQNAGKCCLTDNEILKLARIAVELEKAFVGPRDIEWAYSEGQLYILQARPITTLNQETNDDIIHEFDTPIASATEVLTTANIGEMMPGAMTPLTISTFARGVEYSLQEMFSYAGIYSKTFDIHKLLGICGNAAFINMHGLTGVCEQHFISSDRRMLCLALLGEVIEKPSMEDIIQYWGKSSVPYGILNGIKQLWRYKQSSNLTRRWEDRLKTYSFGEHARAESLYQAINDKLPDYYQTWSDTVCNSSRSASWSQILMAILTQGKPEWKPEHYADVAVLLSSCDNVFSADVPAALKELAVAILEEGKTDFFRSATAEEATQWLLSPSSGDLQRQFKGFLSRHGHRCVRESEFRELSWQSRPEKVVQVLQTMLSNPESLTHQTKQTLDANEALSKIKSPVTWFGKLMLKWVLPRARRAVGDREWGKSVSIQMVEVFKLAYWKLADMMVKEGFLPDEDLLFFLTHKEIGTVLKTRPGALIAKAQRRRKLLEKQKLMKFNRLYTGHPYSIEAKDDNFVASAELKGMPVSQGVAQGVARVVHSIQEACTIQPGDILIVPYTDVGWSPYFPMISGLVTEIGGLISHGAVVAREYGLPCIVNIPGVTGQLKSGDIVRLDGNTGILKKLESDPK